MGTRCSEIGLRPRESGTGSALREKSLTTISDSSAGLFHRSSKGSIRFKRSPTRSCLTLEDDVVWDGLMYKQSFHRTTKE